MSIAIITGSSGLIGSESVNFFCKKGFDVVGIDKNLRKFFFGDSSSTFWIKNKLIKTYKNFNNYNIDIRDCLLYTSPSPRDRTRSRMPSSA